MTRLSLIATFALLFSAAVAHSTQPELQRFQIRHRPVSGSLVKKQLGVSVGVNVTSDDSDGTGKAGILDLLPGLGGDDGDSSSSSAPDQSTSSPTSAVATSSDPLPTSSSDSDSVIPTTSSSDSSSVSSTSSIASSTSSSSSSVATTSSRSSASSSSSSIIDTASFTTDSTLTAPTSNSTLLGQSEDNNKSDGGGLSKTVITLIVIGSSVLGAFLIWTAVRKWRLGTSERFQERMRPMSFGPNADDEPTFGAVKRSDAGFNEKNNGWNQVGEYGNDGGHQRGGSGDSQGTGYGATRNGPPMVPQSSLNRQDSWGNRSGYGGADRPVFERSITPQPQAPQQGYAAPQFPPMGQQPPHVAYNMGGMDPYAQDAQALPYPEFNRMNARTPQPGFDPYYRGPTHY